MARAAVLAAVCSPGAASTLQLTCDNGLPAVVDERPGTGTVYVEIGVRAGSRDEPTDRAGMAHLLEHLLFKEGHGVTARRNPAFSALRSLGAVVNASTDFELTEYHADLPADRFDEGWSALLSMVTSAAFDEEEVARERGVVLQEVALGKTDPLAIAAYSVLRRIFPGDPIGQPVIGFRRTLRRIDRSDLLWFYRRHYIPANMFAVIAGDVDATIAAGRVRTTLGALPAGGAAHAPYPRPHPQGSPLYRFRTVTRQSYLIAGALTEGEDSPDAPALRLLATILGGGRASRLHRRLVDREALTDEVLALSFQVSNAGAFGCGLAVDPRRAAAARAALVEEMARLAGEPVGDEEIEVARAAIRGQLALELETNEGLAQFRARRLLSGKPISLDAFLEEIAGPTPEDLLQAARRHWGSRGPTEIQVLPARGFGKVIAALKFLIFRRL